MEGRRREWGRRTPHHQCAQPDASLLVTRRDDARLRRRGRYHRDGVLSVRYMGVVDWRSQDPRADPHGRQRDDTRILPGRPLAGLRVERVRTQRSLRAAVSRPRRASPDFHQRRRATRVEPEWSGTVLRARRGIQQRQQCDDTHVRQGRDGPGVSGGNARTDVRERMISGPTGEEVTTLRRMDSGSCCAQPGSAIESGAGADDLRAALVRGAEAPRAHPLTFAEP